MKGNSSNHSTVGVRFSPELGFVIVKTYWDKPFTPDPDIPLVIVGQELLFLSDDEMATVLKEGAEIAQDNVT